MNGTPSGAHRAAAATLAAGIAAAFIPGATVDSVLKTMTAHCSYLVRRALELTMDLAHVSETVDGFAEKLYDKMLDWTWPSRNWQKERFFSASTLEIVPATRALFYLCDGRVNECIVEGASFGRDCDTIGRSVGCLAGALRGAGSIRQDWIKTVEKANEDLFGELEGDSKADFCSMARRLPKALQSERQATQERLDMLNDLLG